MLALTTSPGHDVTIWGSRRLGSGAGHPRRFAEEWPRNADRRLAGGTTGPVTMDRRLAGGMTGVASTRTAASSTRRHGRDPDFRLTLPNDGRILLTVTSKKM